MAVFCRNTNANLNNLTQSAPCYNLDKSNYTTASLNSGSRGLATNISSYEVAPDARVCLYTSDNYAGLAAVVDGPKIVTNMGSLNDRVKSLKVRDRTAACFQNVSSDNDTEYFQTQPPPPTNTNLYLLILLLVIAYFFFLRK